VPKIQWSGLPEALRKHLLLRLKERQITEQDLLKLMEWRQSEPEAPDRWYKDFGSFKICGEGTQRPSCSKAAGQGPAAMISRS
jgi:carbonic anhydrase